jgi:undecaprenyl diphosphate synthase
MGLLKKLTRKNESDEIDYSKLPVHIAIIMDGNGRWAKKRGLPRNIGHREGSNTLKGVAEFCDKIGVKHLTVYAFSTENWKRPKSEVDALMGLLLDYLKNAEKELAGKNIRLKVIGNKEGLPNEIHEQIKKVEELTKNRTGLNFNLALNYGSRDEIIYSVKEIATLIKEGKLKVDEIGEDTISNNLYTKGIPDPDLIIRTSGEQRISNFLLWQCAYSEFYFVDTLWPEFKEKDILKAIKEFQKRNRRYGGV